MERFPMIEVTPLKSNPEIIDEIVSQKCNFRFLTTPDQPLVLLHIATPEHVASYVFSKPVHRGPRPVLSINEAPAFIRDCPNLHLKPAENSTNQHTLQLFTGQESYVHVEMMDHNSYWVGVTHGQFTASLNIQIPNTRTPFKFRPKLSLNQSTFGLRQRGPLVLQTQDAP